MKDELQIKSVSVLRAEESDRHAAQDGRGFRALGGMPRVRRKDRGTLNAPRGGRPLERSHAQEDGEGGKIIWLSRRNL